MLEKMIEDLEKELENLNKRLEIILKEIETTEKEVNVFVKYINRQKYKKLINQIEILKNQRDELKLETSKINEKLSSDRLKVDELLEIISQGSEDAIIGEKEVEIILKTCMYENQKKAIEDISSIALVHKTRYCPRKNKIETGRETKAKNKIKIDFSDKSYEVEYYVGQNSIHFAMNGPVGDHDWGSWSDCKYAIIIPFDKVSKENLLATRPEDTYFEGGVEIPEGSIVICPKDELSKTKQIMKNIRVIAYDNVSLDDVIKCLLITKGVKVKSVSNNGWRGESDYKRNYEDIRKLEEIRLEYSLPEGTSHLLSDNILERNFFSTFSFMINLIKILIEEKRIVSEEEMITISNIIYYILYARYEGDTIEKRKEIIYQMLKYTHETLYGYNLVDEYTCNNIYLNIKKLNEISNMQEYQSFFEYVNKYTTILFGNLNEYIKKIQKEQITTVTRNIK